MFAEPRLDAGGRRGVMFDASALGMVGGGGGGGIYGVGAGSEERKLAIWEQPVFTADMCEALVTRHETLYGEYAPFLRVLLEELLNKSLPEEARTGIIQMIQGLQRSENLFKRRQHYLLWRIPFHLSRIVDEIGKQLQTSAVGDVHVFPIECGDPGIAIVHHERQGQFSLGVVNVNPINKMPYHAYSPNRPPKLLMQTVLEVKNIPKARITSEAFWACDLLSEVADEMVVYTHFLPWLNGKTHAEITNDTSEGPYCTGTKSWNGNLWKTFIHATKYVMRKAGAPEEDIKAVRFMIKQKLLTAVRSDLKSLESIQYSTRLILQSAVQNIAMSLTRNQKNITEEDFNATRTLVDDVTKKIEELPCPDEATTAPPPELNLTENWDKATHLDMSPFCEVFRRLENVDAFIGTAVDQPRYVPVNFFKVPEKVTSFDEALLLLDELVRVCTRISTQMDVVKNAGFLISALMTQVFCSILPSPLGPKTRAQGKEDLWNAVIKYGQQIHCLKRLFQCAEFFMWASFSGTTTKEYDAQRIVVLGAIATIGDAVIRILASDHPSVISQHLRGFKRKSAYGITPGRFATQTENCVIVYPELCMTRCAILDYHNEICEDIPAANVMWAWEDGWAFCKATQTFIRQICILEGFSTSNVMQYFAMELTSHTCILGKFWEEYRYHRDLYIMFKWMMGPKNRQPTCTSCLNCKTASPHVEANYGNHRLQVRYMHKEVVAKAGQLRWPSFAIPSKFTAPFEAASEDDILHIKNLPTFDDVMGQRDSELLLSYLTAPYMSIPLVLTFFATEDRVSCLGNDTIKNILEAVLFEPAKFLPRHLQNKVPTQVPAEDSSLVATPYGVLFNELQFSPNGVVQPLIRLVKLAKEMDAGTVHNHSVVDIILFLVRTVARVESYINLVLQLAATPEPPRGIAFDPASILALRDGQMLLRELVEGTLIGMLESWVNEVMAGVVKNAEKSSDIDEATRTSAQLHSHILLLLRNTPKASFNTNIVSLAMSSTIFLTTRHTWNEDNLDVPETELFDVLQIHRRNIVAWLSKASVKELSWVLDSVVRIATSTGTRTEGPPYNWGFVAGEDCVGRFTRVDADTTKREGFDNNRGELMKSLYTAFKISQLPDGSVCINEGLQDVEINMHILSLTFKAAHLVALPGEIAGMGDVHTVFAPTVGGNAALLNSMQCAIIQDAEHRRWVRLVGQEHDIQFWKTPELRVPLPADAMRFYPDELAPTEEWIYKVVEPIRKAFFVRSSWQPPIFLLLPEKKLTSDQCVVVLTAVCSKTGKKLKEIVAFRDHNCCNVYELISIGRRYYRRLIFSSDCHFSLRELQPETGDRRTPWPAWQRHAAGDINADESSEDDQSVIILRHPTHPDNVSKSLETFIPRRVLEGLLPDALLATHMFWQDPDDNIRGYPKEKNAMHILWGHWKELDFTQIGTDQKQVCFKVVRFARAKSAPKVSETAILKSQKLHITDDVEEELERIRTASTEELDRMDTEDQLNADLSEGMFREATTMYQPKSESATIEDHNLLFVNLLYAPTGTPLHSLAKLFARLELLSHVICWTTDVDYNPSKSHSVSLDLIYLPRLKLSFSAKIDQDGVTRLYSLDHAHLFVCNQRPKLVCTLLQGIPHSILLGDLNESMSILVPALEVVRPRISQAQFSTELVINRSNRKWYEKLDTRYYLYPVHVSLSFMFTPTLASALYLLVLRFLHCEYEEVFKLASTIGTDVEFSAEEKQNFQMLQFDDERPEAHACRSKIGLLVADSPVTMCWYLPYSCAKMIRSSSVISLGCRLSESEERRLLHITSVLLKKMEVIHETTKRKDVKSETVETLIYRISKDRPLFDGSTAERKHLKNLFELVRTRLRETMSLRVANSEIVRLFWMWSQYRRFIDFPPYFQAVIENRAAFLEAEAKGIETGEPVQATYIVPKMGKDELWTYYRDYNPLSVKVPESQTRQKNDEQRPVTMSSIFDYFYCGTTVRKAGMCKCKDCGEDCGEVGCPCPSCERFNKANLDKLRYIPSSISGASTKIVSFYDAFSWIESLFSEDSSARDSMDSVPADQLMFSSRVRRVTMRDDDNTFLRYYEMLTGTTKIRIGTGDCAKDLAALLFPLCHEARRSECALGHLTHFLLNNPQIWNKLPKYNRTAKTNFETRMNGIYNAIISQAAQNCRYPPEPPMVAPRPQKFEVTVVPRPHERFNPETPIKETRVLPNLANTDCRTRVWKKVQPQHLEIERDASTGNFKEEIECDDTLRADLRAQPLREATPEDTVTFLSRKEQELHPISGKLNFDLHRHEAANRTVAKSMIQRVEQDMEDFASQENNAKAPKIIGLSNEHEVRNVVVGRGDKLTAVREKLTTLHDNLVKMRDRDGKYTETAFTVLERSANAMALPKGVDDTAATLMHLRRVARQEAVLALSYLISCLSSTVAESDWRQLNPFLTNERCDAMISLIIGAILRANRMGHANRAAEASKELLTMLHKAEHPPESMNNDEAALHTYREALVTSILQKADALGGILGTKRVYINEDFSFDPRFLIFEFTWNLVLRSRQKILINEMYDSICANTSIVKQMIMGAGKTTVVGPLLDLMLADTKNLVIQVVPPALLDFTRSILRATFSTVIQKQIFCFQCDRASDIDSEVLTKFLHAKQSRGIVVTTPSSIKSIFLKYVEGLDRIEDTMRIPLPGIEHEVHDLGRVLSLWKDAVLIMDEVDMLLHPLKSELNFPIGAKHDIDFSPMRWKLPIHLFDALFFFTTKRVSVSMKENPEAHRLLQDISGVIRRGLNENALQSTPHLTLLNLEYYEDEIKMPMTKWAMLLLKAHHFAGLTEEETQVYITTRPSEEKNPELNAKVQALEPDHIKSLNLSFEWINSFLPHCLQKIDRVSFGIMNADDMKRAREEHPTMPRSRFVTSIPFVGKDLPSQSSEFAHPDVVIGLTVLAYRYEGLRHSDFTEIMRQIHAAVEKEVGRFHQRRTNLLYNKWVAASGGRLLQSFSYEESKKGAALDDEIGMQPSESLLLTSELLAEEEEAAAGGAVDDHHRKGQADVLPLKLMKQANADESMKLYKLFRRTPEVIHWYLCETIFPEHMRHQRSKLSASGQELGGNILFDRRIGFSGTPSDLLPSELGKCEYEPGTDGKLIHTLTSPVVMRHTIAPNDWTVRSLLDWVANATPTFHALIDTGALITGMSNLQVAQYLLKHGLPACEGVVFLDEYDRKMILVRATGRVLKLAECGIPMVKRFAFYDQVHTTGMDIQHTPNAVAVQTLGKDMTFRDFAQGAYRMRGIAQGQKVHLLIIPEVRDLINRTLSSMRRPTDTKSVLNDVTAWLLVNSVRSEHTQHNQLCLQSIGNVWRKQAFRQLMSYANEGKFKIGTKVPQEAVDALEVYREPVDYAVPQLVPQPQMFSETISKKVDERLAFIVTDDGKAVVKAICENTKREDEIDNPVIDVQMVQEQEEEREAVVEKEKEQEIEMEKFVDLAYSRDEELPVPWAVNSLRDYNRSVQFYRLADFHLYKRRSLSFPQQLMLSRNFFNPKWSGHRRMKNVVVAMEWIPDLSQVKELDASSIDYNAVPAEDGKAALARTLEMLIAHQGELNPSLCKDFFGIALAESGSPGTAGSAWTAADIQRLANLDKAETVYRLLASNFLRREESGRYTVALALAEAETLRRIMHQRVLTKQPFIEGCQTHLALTISPSNNTLLDATPGFVEAKTHFQRFRAYQCLRFFDSDLHYTEQELNLLLRSVHEAPEKQRQAYFLQLLACRRRARQRWERTPVSLLFNLPTPFTLLHQRTIGLCLRRDLDSKELHIGDAFLAMNSSHSGQLSADEVFGALRWCKLNVSAAEVLDFIRVADTHHEGTIQYQDFIAMLTGCREVEDDEGTKDDMASKKLPTIEPHGGEELRVLRAEEESKRRTQESEASKEMESEDKRVREEIEQEQMREELALIQTSTNPLLTDNALSFSFIGKDMPKLAKFFGMVKPKEKYEQGDAPPVLETGSEEETFYSYNEDGYVNLVTRSLKLATGETNMTKYLLNCEFCLPRPKRANAKESKEPTLKLLENEGNQLELFRFYTNHWHLMKGVRVGAGGAEVAAESDDDEYDEEDYYDDEDYDDDDSDDYGGAKKDAYYVYSVTDRDRKNRTHRLNLYDVVEEMIGERMTTSSGSLGTEWMKVCKPIEGWVIFDENGKRFWRRERVQFAINCEGSVVVDSDFTAEKIVPPTVFEEEKPDDDASSDSDDDFWGAWRWIDFERGGDEDNDDEEEEEGNAFDMGDLSDLVAALKKAKELKQGDKVTRNPECWEGHGNEDGGEGTVGKVVKVEEATVQVQWPNGHKGTYCWGASGKFELIKVGSVEDDDDLGRDVTMDDQWGPMLKKKSKQRCSNCSQSVGLDSNWFRCNQCTGYNLCKKCFKNMEHQEHEFTDMVALSDHLKSSEVVRGSMVRIKAGITPSGGWGDAPRDGTPGMVSDLDDENETITVLFNDEPWHGMLSEVEVVHPKFEQYSTCWLGSVFNVTLGVDKLVCPALAAVVDQSFVVPEIQGKFKIGQRVKASYRHGSYRPGHICALLPKKRYAVDFDDGSNEPSLEEERIEAFPFNRGMKVRLKRPENGGNCSLPKGVTGGMIAEIQSISSYSGRRIRLRLLVRNGMKKTFCNVYDEQVDELGKGKFFCKRPGDDAQLPLPNSCVVLLEKAFCDGVVPRNITLQGQEYEVDFDEMLLTNAKSREQMKLVREPEEKWTKKREELHLDDGKWHTISILVNGNEDILALCDGNKMQVDYLGPNDLEDEGDEEDEETSSTATSDSGNETDVEDTCERGAAEEALSEGGTKKEEKEEKPLSEEQQYAINIGLPAILDDLSAAMLKARPEEPLGFCIEHLSSSAAVAATTGTPTPSATTAPEEAEEKKPKKKKVKHSATEESLDSTEGLEEDEDEEGWETDAEAESSATSDQEEETEEEEGEGDERGDALGGWNEHDDDDDDDDADGPEVQRIIAEPSSEEDEESDSDEEEVEKPKRLKPVRRDIVVQEEQIEAPQRQEQAAEERQQTLDADLEDGEEDSEDGRHIPRAKRIKRCPVDFLTLDVRNSISSLVYPGTGLDYRGKFGVTFPVRHVASASLCWAGDASLDYAKKVFSERNTKTRWICESCGEKNSRLLDSCTKCNRSRIEVVTNEGKKSKMRAANPSSKEAQDVRKKMHSKLRSQYQQQLDELEDFTMVL